MKKIQSEITHTSKQRGFRFWIGLFTLIVGLPLLLYYGYCWGLWGRGSLLLQYLFQCNCPPASEQTRYPDRVKVIVPACKYYNSIISPSGRLLYVEEKTSGSPSTYLLDLQTDEKTPFVLAEGSNHFLTDDLLFLSLEYGHGYEGGEYILDRMNGKQYPIRKFMYWRSNAYVNGETNLNVLAQGLQEAKEVFVIDNDIIVALAADFRAFPERNFLSGWFDIPGEDPDRVEQFLQKNKISYHYVPDMFLDEALSSDRRFIARADGIYLTTTGQKIVEGYSARGLFHPYSGENFSVRGWTYDGTGVIYSKFLNPCLVEASFFLSDEPGCFFEVPQPVIKLKVPEEYLLPMETP